MSAQDARQDGTRRPLQRQQGQPAVAAARERPHEGAAVRDTGGAGFDVPVSAAAHTGRVGQAAAGRPQSAAVLQVDQGESGPGELHGSRVYQCAYDGAAQVYHTGEVSACKVEVFEFKVLTFTLEMLS